MRICIANFLLSISLHMFYPVLPIEMANRLGVSVSQTGIIFLLLTLGMFAIGPFQAYLIDAYKRKFVCMLSFAGMLAAIVGYTFVRELWELYVLVFGQGIAFGMGSTAGVTLAIDITNSPLRYSGNVAFSWAARMGMFTGIAAGIALYQIHELRMLVYLSIGVGVLALFLISQVSVPFRAPIVTKFCSSDRFFLLRGWLPAINIVLIAFVPGILIPAFHHSLNEIMINGTSLSYFAMVAIGFFLSAILLRFFLKGEKSFKIILTGLLLIAVSLFLIGVTLPVSGILLGMGMGIAASEFLLMFVKLSQHCQRGTANTTRLLSWETGIGLGVLVACSLSADYSLEAIFPIGRFASVAALLFFMLITYPYFKRTRVR